jgi:hypothetical protein
VAIRIERAGKIKKAAPKSNTGAETPQKAATQSKKNQKQGRRGGKRPGAGRKKGSENRATVAQKTTVSHLARQHTDVAMKALRDICEKGISESARVAAANSLLDRGYGKPTQAHEHTGKDGGPISTVDLTHATPEQLAALEDFFGPLADAGADDEGDPGGEGAAQD